MFTSKGGPDADGDGRQVIFALYSAVIRNETVLGLVVQARKAREPVDAVDYQIVGDERTTLEKAVLGN